MLQNFQGRRQMLPYRVYPLAEGANLALKAMLFNRDFLIKEQMRKSYDICVEPSYIV